MKKRLFKIEHPDIYIKIDLEKNKHIDFDTLSSSSDKIIYLKCNNPSHNWHASVYDLTRQDKRQIKECKLCKRGLVVLHPWITKVWDYDMNEDTPEINTTGSHKMRFFKCLTCKKSYPIMISNRIKCKKKENGGCAFCIKIKVDKENSFENCGIPKLLEEFDLKKNVLTPYKLSFSSTKEVWWICSVCSHSWSAKIAKRRKGTGCPKCKNVMSRAEIVTLHQINYIFGHAEKLVTDLNEIDVFIEKYNIGIEVDGAFHKERGKQDFQKNKGYQERGIKIFRLRDKSLGFNINNEQDVVFDQSNFKKTDLNKLLKLILNHVQINDQATKIRIDNFLSSRFFINEKELLNQIQIDKKRVPNNLEEERLDLLEEWDYKKNLLSPSSYALGSNEKVYWICPKGHSYSQDINKKIYRNRKCPYCNKNDIIPGYNSCIDKFPDLYTYVKNPSSVNLYKFGEKSSTQVEWVTGKHSIRYFIKSFYLKIKFLIFKRN